MTKKMTKPFMSGYSQAVRIPREFQLDGDEVEIKKRGNTLVLRPTKKSWGLLVKSLEQFTDDFLNGRRKQPTVQKRKRAFS